jgi:hypothetical protein
MKNIISVLFIIAVIFSAEGQNVSETNISIGMSKTSSSLFKQKYDEEPPTFFILNGSKSWYSNDSWISLRKEAGVNLQYAHIDLSSGGLGAANHYTGNIISLFANASLQGRIQIIHSMNIGIGPEAELLLIGINKLNNEYYSMIYNPPTAGNKDMSGINRDYFNQPSYGIKLSLYESAPQATTTIGIHFSYLWTKSEPSNFYTDNYSRISLMIGFKKQKEESPVEPVN